MRTLRLVVLAALVLSVPAAVTRAGARPGLSLAQARAVATRLARSAAKPDGFASIGSCSRFTSWRVACRAEISLATGICTETILVSNSLTTAKGYYHRSIAFRHLKCVGAPGPSPPSVTPPAPPAVPPPTYPTELPQSVGQSVATAYVGGMMRQAYATSGGVSSCGGPVGLSVTCLYSYSGIANDGSFYSCFGQITVNGVYAATGWQTSVYLGLGPTCT
jgi:hypothetical protein